MFLTNVDDGVSDLAIDATSTEDKVHIVDTGGWQVSGRIEATLKATAA